MSQPNSASPIQAINVIEFVDGKLMGLASFESQSVLGCEAAEALFGRLAMDHGVSNEVEISDAINDGFLEVGAWKVEITCSVARPDLMPTFLSKKAG